MIRLWAALAALITPFAARAATITYGFEDQAPIQEAEFRQYTTQGLQVYGFLLSSSLGLFAGDGQVDAEMASIYAPNMKLNFDNVFVSGSGSFNVYLLDDSCVLGCPVRQIGYKFTFAPGQTSGVFSLSDGAPFTEPGWVTPDLVNTVGFDSPSGHVQFDDVTFDLTPVPEPATWMTMLLGLAGAGAVLRRRPCPARSSSHPSRARRRTCRLRSAPCHS